MPNKCVVCGKRRDKNSTFSFHRFPKVKEIRKQWVQACKVNEQDITTESLVCSKHFKVEDFDATVWPRKKLVAGVVPTPSIIYDLWGKSKKIKLDNEKNIKVHTGPQSIGELEWVNHEIIIKDEHVEEKSNNGTLKSGKTTKFRKKKIQLALPPIISDHDYIFHNLKATDQEMNTFRKDIFCVESERRNPNVPMNFLETFNESLKCNSKISPSKTDTLEIDSKLNFKNKLVDDKIDAVNLSDNCMKEIDLAITSEGSEHSSNSKLPVMLLKVDPKSVPPEIKARTLVKANMNISSNCIVSQVNLKHIHPPSKVVSSKTLLVENIEKLDKQNISNINLVHINEDLKKSFGETSNSHKNPLINNRINNNAVSNEIVMEANSSEQVKYGTTNKNIITVSVHDQNSCEDDNSNVKENHQSDIPEVRLSSLANLSQVAMEYGPNHSSIVSQNEMKASTSVNIAGTNNIDLMKDNTDEDTDEELGLNSLEELEQFWEFIVELHDYNKQLIRAQQNKKRRYLLKIKKFEHDLQQNFGIELEKSEEENDESSDGNLKIPCNIEEKNVTLKKNESKEKE